jgi:hypothetical protein
MVDCIVYFMLYRVDRSLAHQRKPAVADVGVEESSCHL